ncbi:MAG: LytTR family transcriptional regulator DNA-binding domain-containing protein [Clostridiales bacterium]|nr:LytTR family transcriptional regulator DNA-binding domain-containing protein [Clostridiales bacterium]
MKINLFQSKETEEHIDIYYKEMSPLINRVIAISSAERSSQLIGKNNDGQKVYFEMDQVFYFESVDKKTFAYLKNQIFEVEERLNSIEEELGIHGFIRINKSNVVNIYYIQAIKPELNMRVRAIMENGEYLMINRSYKKNFERFLKERRVS